MKQWDLKGWNPTAMSRIEPPPCAAIFTPWKKLIQELQAGGPWEQDDIW